MVVQTISQLAPSQTAAQQKSHSPEKIDALTSLRFFACFFMVFYHAHAHFFGRSAELNHDTFAPIVAFFFALSGFVITHNYSKLSDKRSILSFYLFRYARMLPIHILTAIAFVWLLPGLFRPSGAIFFSNLSLTHAWFPWSQFFFSYNSPSWSNSTEIFFYLCFPLLLVCMRTAWYLPLLIGLVPAIATILVCNILQVPHMSLTSPCVVGLIFVHPVSRIFEFTVGMVVALLFRTRLKPANLHPLAASALEVAGLSWVLLAAFNSSFIRHELIPTWGDAGSLWVQSSALPVLGCGLLIAALATEKGLIGRFLNWRLLVVLGECSFAMYMLHSLLLTYASVSFPQALSLGSYFLFWATLIVGGHFLTTVVDPWLRKVVLSTGFKIIDKVAPEKTPAKSRQPDTKKKNWKQISLRVAEAALLAFLCWSSLPPLHRLDEATAAEALQGCAVRNVVFGSYLNCKGATARRDGDDIKVKMIWESLQPGKSDYFVKATALNLQNEEVGCRIYCVSPRRESLKVGTLWQDDVTVSVLPGKQASSVAILVIRKHKLLPAVTPDAVMKIQVSGPNLAAK